MARGCGWPSLSQSKTDNLLNENRRFSEHDFFDNTHVGQGAYSKLRLILSKSAKYKPRLILWSFN